uniref:Uncharacterized protein n=1 Tax=Arundo donax TaxID=35708 RepID=A0A0A9C6B6_ARUDO
MYSFEVLLIGILFGL